MSMTARSAVLTLLLFGLIAIPAHAAAADEAEMTAREVLQYQYERILEGTAGPAHFIAFQRYLTAEKERYDIAAQEAKESGKTEKSMQARQVSDWFGEQEAIIAKMLEIEWSRIRISRQKNDAAKQQAQTFSGQLRELSENLERVRSNPPKFR
jgi:molecular chaperone GrpE (heat shock protein)